MTYSKSYFEDEVRDGFFVPSIMKKCFASAKKVYDDLYQICHAHGIQCAATYGTMIGAVRHGGFIPWDDDIDIMMTRKDYAELTRIREQGDLGKCRIADYIEGENYDLAFGFTNYENTESDLEEHYGFPFGDMIDIFVFDYIPGEKEEREKYVLALRLLFGMYGKVKDRMENGFTDQQIRKDSEIQEYMAGIYKFLSLSYDDELPVIAQTLRNIEQFCSRYTKEQCAEQGIVGMWYYRGFKNIIFDNWAFDEYVELPFEGGVIHVPIGYDYILRKIYGDYTQPRIAKGGHEYPYFEKLEKKLIDELGEKLLRYEYEPEAVKENMSKNKGKRTLLQEIREDVSLLAEAHTFICGNLQQEDMLPAVLDTLEQCQALAVEMGGQIEKRGIHFEEMIRLLEEYCDLVFEVYQKIQNSLNSCDSAEQLSNYEEKIIDQAENVVQEKRNVVFLVYKPELWKAMHTQWEKERASEDVNVTVIPVPYYYRDYRGALEREMNIQEEGYPEEVELTSYEEYNFETNHPDVVYFQFPYDEYNYALSLHPFFYTSNLRQYVEKMVFVPPYLLNEIDADDSRSRYTLKWFLCTPGLVYADEILVQSEQMKGVYQEILEEFTGRDNAIKWSEKIVPSEFPLKIWEEKQRILIKNPYTGELLTKEGEKAEKRIYDEVLSIPNEWEQKIFRENGTCRKVALYYASGSVIYQRREQAIAKMEQVLSLAEEKRESQVLILYTDSYIKDILRKRFPSIWGAYRDLLAKFRESDFVILDETNDYLCAAKLCSSFHGDAGILMSECRRQKDVTVMSSKIF